MQLLGVVFSILVGIAGLIQGVDAALNLWQRWKAGEEQKSGDKSDTKSREYKIVSVFIEFMKIGY